MANRKNVPPLSRAIIAMDTRQRNKRTAKRQAPEAHRNARKPGGATVAASGGTRLIAAQFYVAANMRTGLPRALASTPLYVLTSTLKTNTHGGNPEVVSTCETAGRRPTT